MKIYTLLETNKGLIKIITYPENPDLGMKLFFDTYAHRKSESVLLGQEIREYVQASVYGKTIGKKLAMAIANDYPLLFKRPLEFPNLDFVPSIDDEIFSQLSGNLKSHAENQLANLDQQIAQNPDEMKFKIRRAELLCNSGEYYRAKSEYLKLSPSCVGKGHYEFKIENGLTECDLKIKKSTTIFQTPFSIEEEFDLDHADNKKVGDKNAVSKNISTFFSVSNSKEDENSSEKIDLTKDLSLSFSSNEDENISFSILIDGVKKDHMLIDEKDKQELVSYRHDTARLISVLKTWGETAKNIAGLIESNLSKENNNQPVIKTLKSY